LQAPTGPEGRPSHVNFFPLLHPGVLFLNVDEIQHELSPPRSQIAAAREFLHRLDLVERRRENFAVETTLSSRTYAGRIPRWQSVGYFVTLHFIDVPSADYAVARVAGRVAAGGHDVPEDDVRRRFSRGRQLLPALYQSLVDEWYY
jgi:predicted ABC-type ATPase